MSTIPTTEQPVAETTSELERKEGEYLQNLKRLVVGSGDQVMKVDQNGLFLGDANFTDAPWRVDFTGVQTLGDGAIVLDGPNGIITVGSTTVIDEGGLNSTQNFQTDSVLNLGPFSTSSTSFTALSGASLTPFTLDRDTRVLVFANYEGTMGSALDWIDDSDWGTFRIYDTDTSTQRLIFTHTGSAATYIEDDGGGGFDLEFKLKNISYSKVIMLTFGAGQHTLRAEMKTTGNSTEISGLDFGYVILGL